MIARSSNEKIPTIHPEPWGPPSPEAAERLRRLRGMAWLLDRSIPLGRYRIGLDPLIGLVPGVGDWLGALLSIWMIYEAIRLGLPLHILARMGLNVAIEALVGAVPVLGDLFDAVWQANVRNLQLVERHYNPNRRPRSVGWILTAFVVLASLLLFAVGTLAFLATRLLWNLFAGG